LRAYEKDYFRKNAERFSERNKGYRAKDPEKTKTARQKEYQRNKKRYQAWSKEYREANIDRLKDYYRARVAANPEQYRTYKRNYKARKRSAAGSHTQPDVREIFFAQRGKCGYCRVKLGKGYHVDHITALANGGSNDRKNLQILCGPCNNSKSAKDPIDFARSRGMLI
jgi:5-methylcytosine-specific restriction endonuclease McrA